MGEVPSGVSLLVGPPPSVEVIRMPLNRCVPCVFLVLGAACARWSAVSPANDDAAVYSAALDSLAAPRPRFVVMDSIIAIRPDAPLLADLRLGHAGADSVMAAGLRDASRTSRPVPLLRTRRDWEFLSRGELRQGGWRAFAIRHPGAIGVFQVSGIGYSRDRRRAVVYVQRPCGFNCYSSWLVSLTNAGGWRVEAIRLQVVV